MIGSSVELLGLLRLSGVLAGTLVAGLLAHEGAHYLALRLSGVRCTIDILPGAVGDGDTSGIRSPIARVRPTGPMGDVPPTRLRIAALTPLCLSAPLALIFLGALPNPFVSGTIASQLALVAWLGCSLPSPQDFSLAWYPEAAIASTQARTDRDRTPPAPGDTVGGGRK